MTIHRACIVVAAGALALTIAGCASTEKTYEKAVKAEEAGRYEEAAEYYIKVLRKEPDWPDARGRLESTGRIVIDNHLATVSRMESAGDYVAAADQMAQLASFHARATGVGARLELPDDFERRRERLEDQALQQLLRSADEARRSGRWSDALRLFDRAVARGGLSPAEVSSVRESRAAVLVEWSDESLQAGRYRMAFEKAQQAMDIVGVEHRLAARIRSIQTAALEAGSRFVAMLPVGATEGVRRDASDLLLTDINDILVYEYWASAPPFILVADPVAVRRELRNEVGRRGRVVSRNEAIAVARAVDADWVVVPEIAGFERSERIVDRKTIKTRTRGRGARDTTYVLARVEVHYRTRASVRIYDVVSGERLYEGDVESSLKDRYDRGQYTGDYRHLDLSGSELSHFDPDELRSQTDRIEEALADELARKIAERVYSRTVSWIQ